MHATSAHQGIPTTNCKYEMQSTRCVQELEDTRRSLVAEQAAQLAHLESTREAASAERSAKAKKFQVGRLFCAVRL